MFFFSFRPVGDSRARGRYILILRKNFSFSFLQISPFNQSIQEEDTKVYISQRLSNWHSDVCKSGLSKIEKSGGVNGKCASAAGVMSQREKRYLLTPCGGEREMRRKSEMKAVLLRPSPNSSC